MKESWYQVEFLSKLDGRWIPLFGRCPTLDDARDSRKWIKAGTTRIVHITREVEVINE